MANSRTWKTACNLALSDCSTVALQCKSILFALHQQLLGLAFGATVGPLGAPDGAYLWTLAQCSDSVTVKTDGTNLLTTTAKLVRAAGGVAHSWAVYFNATLGYYLTVDYAAANDYTANVYASLVAPTGGTTTARPTAANEFGAAFAFSPNSAWTAGRAHITMSANGDFWAIFTKNGNVAQAAFGFTLPAAMHTGDTVPVLFCESNSSTSLFSTADTVATAFATRSPWGTSSGVATIVTQKTPGNTDIRAVISTASTDGTWESWPIRLIYTGTDPGSKGLLVDVVFVPDSFAQAARVPTVGDVEKICFGDMLFPFTAVPLF